MRSLQHLAILLLQLFLLQGVVNFGPRLAAAYSGASATLFSVVPPGFVCPEGLFAFGGSVVDTGNSLTAMPFASRVENLPYGVNFFKRPARRYSDGRVIVDYLAQAFKFPLLTPYLRSIDPDFSRGANFGYAGATIIRKTATYTRFFFGVQQNQLLRLKQNSLQVRSQAPALAGFTVTRGLPRNETFSRGLYIIKFGLKNDLSELVNSGALSFENATREYVPEIVSEIISGIQNLYENAGARMFMVFNPTLVGCLPSTLTAFAQRNVSFAEDEFGCVAEWNDLQNAYNCQLDAAIKNLRPTLPNATIFLADSFSVQKKVFSNPESFGFKKEFLLKTCCGYGGEYNYDEDRKCADKYEEDGITTRVGACESPNDYVSWDGIHDTEALSRIYAQYALTGKFLDPPVDLSTLCDLDLSKFSDSTFAEAYPNATLLD
ncbi:hypothetical protein R1sor_022853 [Riccia sorocarpa]|uniref:GDSL esterase/lipase n=1 Tax=Riccia sorocarpa TaxID=122646 RepID=A0ABD3GP22_9MARC